KSAGDSPVEPYIALLHLLPRRGSSREARTQVDESVEMIATVLENFQKSGVPVNNGQRAEPETRTFGGLRLVKKPLGISRRGTVGTKCQRPAGTNRDNALRVQRTYRDVDSGVPHGRCRTGRKGNHAFPDAQEECRRFGWIREVLRKRLRKADRLSG